MRAQCPQGSAAVDAAAFGLATFRLARLVGQDDLPPLKRLRDRLTAGRPLLAEAVTCPWCASVYVAASMLALRRLPGGRRLVQVLAASAVAGLLSTADSALGRAWQERATTHAYPTPSFDEVEAAFLGHDAQGPLAVEREADVGYP